MSLSHIILLAGYVFNFILIMFILFFEQNDTAHRLTWLLLVSFIPVAGPVLYIMFSGNFFTRTGRMLRATRYANFYYQNVLGEQRKSLDALMQEGSSKELEKYGSLIHMNLLYGKSPVLTQNTVHVFKNGTEKFAALFAELERAEKTIHLSYFIIKNDGTGKRLISILERKAREGVTVRLLYDHVGSYRTSARLFSPLKKAGGEIKKFFPVSLINPFWINYRNHRKLVIIDGRTGYFGGMNIGDEYANVPGAWKHYWRDTHVRVTGPAVQMIQKQFLVDWYTSTKTDAFPDESMPPSHFFPGPESIPDESIVPLPVDFRVDNVPIQIVSAGPDDTRNDEIRDAMIHMITSAQKSVYIETPYFTPDNAFFTVLKIAAFSGIDVRVIIPENWDKWYVKLAAMPYISELLSYGVRFWHYPGFIHSKMVIIDELVTTIGSTNMDTRSFSLHFELNAFFYSAEFGRKCTAMFLGDQKCSRAATAEWFSGVSVFRKAIWNFFKLFAPLM